MLAFDSYADTINNRARRRAQNWIGTKTLRVDRGDGLINRPCWAYFHSRQLLVIRQKGQHPLPGKVPVAART